MERPRDISGGFSKEWPEKIRGILKDPSTSVTAFGAVTDLALEKFLDARIVISGLETGFGKRENRDRARSKMNQLCKYREVLEREIKLKSANRIYKSARKSMASGIFDSLRSQARLDIPEPDYELSLPDRMSYISAIIDMTTAMTIVDTVRDVIEEERERN